MNNYKRLNIIVGWIVFVIAAITYIATMEPTASLWDCGEFIATSYKFEVGHPPGAPLFMLLMKVFSLFAGSDVTKVAMMMNMLSALASAFTILFLFWSITYIAKKILVYINKSDELTLGHIIAIIGSGAVGALAYTFSDSFWFSAVEAEVYAMSSMFTALVFWLILKWDEEADKPHSNRWIVLIAYLMGLSIGVHLLNLLVIPAIALVIYFRKYKPSVIGVIITLLVSFVVLVVVMYGIIQGLIQLGSVFELLFVNSFGMPFNSGFLVFLILLAIGSIFFLYWSYKKNKVVLHTAFLSFLMILVGYSSFALLVIRSNANTPIDENNPEDTFALKSYLNREQYGDRPLFWGQYYDAEAIDQEYEYTYIRNGNKYQKVKKVNPKVKYDPNRQTFFPRMFSSSPDHIEVYKEWGGGTDVPTFGNNLKFFMSYQMGWMYMRYFAWNFVGRQNDIQGHGGPLNGNWISGIKPIDNQKIPQTNIPDKWKNRASRNVYFFLPLILGLIGLYYQTKHHNTFWATLVFFIMTGIAIVVYLNQTPYQPRERDYAYVGSFYVFAIWIGLAVLAFYQWIQKYLKSDVLRASVITGLFLLVPVLMAFQNWDDHDRSHRYHARDLAYNYLNSCEKNGVLFTYGDNDTFPLWYTQETEGYRTDVRNVNLSLFSTDWYADQMRRKAYDSDPVPLNLDRSKYIMGVRDVIFVYDNPRALFKEKYKWNIDQFKPKYVNLYNRSMEMLKNSQFPVQYAGDFAKLSEGFEKIDIEIFLAFLQSLPNVAQKIGISTEVVNNVKKSADSLYTQITNAYVSIDDVMNFALSDNKENMLSYGNEFVNYIPTKKIFIPVDKEKIKQLGFVTPENLNKVGDRIYFELKPRYLLKAQWLSLKMIADNKWERPIYYAVGIGDENYLGLEKFFRLEGFAFRLMPYTVEPSEQGEIGEINSDIMYERLMNKFVWGNVNGDNFNVDHFVERQFMVLKVRTLFHRLANQLIKEKKNDKAKEVLDRCFEILPDHKIAFDYEIIPLIDDYFRINEIEKGKQVANQLIDNYLEQLVYFQQFKGSNAQAIDRDVKIALYVLQNMYSIALQYNQEDIIKKVEPILKNNIDKLKFE